MDADDSAPPTTMMRRALSGEDAIYGLILVAGMIVVSGKLTGESWGAFLTVLVTVLVFWAAHVYARALSHYVRAGEAHDLRLALREAVRESSGMLIVAVPPLLVLLAGLTRFVDDDVAIMSALILDVMLLGAIGWFAVARWSRNWWARIGGALLTAAFAGVIIALKAIVH